MEQPTVIELSEENYQATIDRYDLVLITFYVEWCRFSQKFHTVLEETAERAVVEFGDQVCFARVNCDLQEPLAKRFNISYYPTIYFTVYGQPYRRQYKGRRTEQEMLSQIRSLLQYDPIQLANDYSDYEQIEVSQSAIIAYSSTEFAPGDANYEQLRRCALHLEPLCRFVWAYGELAADFFSLMTDSRQLVIIYKPPNCTPIDSLHLGVQLADLASYESFKRWALAHELPLLLRCSLDNQSALFNARLHPQLLLYHEVGDTVSIGHFYELIRSELKSKWTQVQLLTVDGAVRIFELEKLSNHRKRAKPIVAIRDGEKGLFYAFEEDFEQLRKPGQLKQFLDDFNSGELERRRLEAAKSQWQEVDPEVASADSEEETTNIGFGLFC